MAFRMKFEVSICSNVVLGAALVARKEQHVFVAQRKEVGHCTIPLLLFFQFAVVERIQVFPVDQIP